MAADFSTARLSLSELRLLRLMQDSDNNDELNGNA